MSAKTKIVVLHMKELIYTGIFVALGILLIILLAVMFLPGKKDSDTPANTHGTEEDRDSPDRDSDNVSQTGGTAVSDSGIMYIPGIYTTELVLNDQTIDVEVVVDQDYISSIRLVNLSESVTTMYPLLQPTFDSLCRQIYEKQSLDNITYEQESKYTSLVLLEAIRNALSKAELPSSDQ